MEDINVVEDSQELAEQSMKELKSPPDEWKEAYEDFKDYYDSFIRVTNLAIDPSGNYQSFTSSFNEANNEAINKGKKLEIYTE